MYSILLKAYKNIVRLLFKADLEPVRFLISIGSILWGVLLILHRETPHIDSADEILLFSILSPTTWAVLFLVSGLSGALRTVFGYCNKFFCLLDLGVGALTWTTTSSILIVSAIIEGVPVDPDLAGHMVLAAFSWLLLVRYANE